jgi:hypothetical protein
LFLLIILIGISCDQFERLLAQTDVQHLVTLLQVLQRQYPRCDVDIVNVGGIANDLPIAAGTASEFATFVSYHVSGCEGGNNWTSYFGLFRDVNGKLFPLRGGL